MRGKDQIDFELVLPLLDEGERSWLRAALELTEPGHEWLGAFG